MGDSTLRWDRRRPFVARSFVSRFCNHGGVWARLVTVSLIVFESMMALPVRAQDSRTSGSSIAAAVPASRATTARVTIDVDRVPLLSALSLVARQAGLRPAYNESVLPRDVRVTLHVRDLPVEEVFEQVLSGTGLIAQIRPAGTVFITRSDTAAANEGGITVIVTDAETKRPIAGVSATVDNGKHPVLTKADGTVLFANLSAGIHKIVVRRLGYRPSSLPVTVRDGAIETVAVALASSATTLTDVVTTATGDRRRLEVGHTVGTIQADSIVPTTLIRNMSDLLQARIPGLVVSNTDGAVGAPSKIRLRGVNSLSLNNDPIIILDGVRLNAQTTSASLQTNVGSVTMLKQLDNPAGGNSTPQLEPSRLDDIDPNTIESIDVMRGPEASSLYGTDAANGVIVIKTKMGRPGSWHTTLSGDVGGSHVPGQMPDAWMGWNHVYYGSEFAQCLLAIGSQFTVANGGCDQDSVTHFNPENYGPMSTLGTGTHRSMSGSLSGGTESLQQFFSVRANSDVGIAKMSDAERRFTARTWSVPVPDWMTHPNSEQDVDGSSRSTINVSPKVDVSIGTMAFYRNVLNGGNGIQNVWYDAGASAADTLSYLPSENQRTKVTSTEKRGTLSATANYRPFQWLAFSGTGGGDYGQRIDESDLLAQYCSVAVELLATGSSICPSGHTMSRGETFVTTLNGGTNLSFVPRSWLSLRTALGENYSHTSFYNLQAGNSNPKTCPLQFGTTLLTPNPICTSSSAQQYSVSEARDEAAAAGVYVEETVNLLGMYTTFGVRQDLASGFGGEVRKSPPNYPKFNISYPLSEQSFFPKQDYISSLRLRLAYGRSGNQASKTAVSNNYSRLNVSFVSPTGAPIPATYIVTQLGNPNLRPEISTSWEGGFDVSFLDNERIHAEVTLYRKFTRDAITSVTLAPSLNNYTEYYNLGNVENRGLEIALTAKVIDTRTLNWELGFNSAKNTNKLVHKAPTLNIGGPLGTQFREGYPLYGYWGVPVESYTDANGDGILEQNEIVFGQQDYMGAPYPKGEMTYNSTLELWNGTLRFAAVLDQIIGQTTQLQICPANQCGLAPRASVDRTAPLGQQAAYIQAVINNNAYLGTSSSVRLNELSATYAVPARLAQRLHAQSLTVTLAGRNLALWTSYAGKDPNVDTSGLFGEASRDNGLGTPQPRSWLLRFNLGL